MANSAQRGSNPDDDSWGKIASDLFGIQFNEDDDFELPDDESPVTKPQPVSPSSPAPVAAVPAQEQPILEEEDIA